MEAAVSSEGLDCVDIMLLITIAGLAAAILAAYLSWWVPTRIRVREVVRGNAPEIEISISRYSGPGGTGFTIRFTNSGRGKAYAVRLTVPLLIPDPTDLADVFNQNADRSIQISLDERNPILTKPQGDLPPAELTFRDAFGFLYTRKLHMQQQAYPGGPFTVSFDVNRYQTSTPTIGRKDVWRLRHQ
jgi:hypothetical protein